MASLHLLLSASARNHLLSRSNHATAYSPFSWRQWHVEFLDPHLRLEARSRKLSKRCNHATYSSSLEGPTPDTERLQLNPPKYALGKDVLEPLLRFPWAKFSERLSEHMVETVWTFGKWLVVPALVISAVREVVFAISVGKELFIPLGLLGGTMAGGILREITLSFGTVAFQGGELPFHILLLMGLLFGVLKVMSYKIPILWVHVCLLQFSNAGLWQTIRFANRGRNLEKASTMEI